MRNQAFIHTQLRSQAWELLDTTLDKQFSYHCIAHTREVCYRALQIARNVQCSEKECDLLYTAAVYHDIGFTISHLKHEEHGIAIFAEKAYHLGLNTDDIKCIEELIRATEPFRPAQDLLQMIIKDADLYYLSTSDYARQAGFLRKELEWLNGPMDDIEWKQFQKSFLDKHEFLTPGIESELNLKKRNILRELQLYP